MAQTRTLIILAAAAVSALAASPPAAHAASPGVSPVAKTEAILGGPSRLAEILAAQRSPLFEPVRPSSYGIRRPVTTGPSTQVAAGVSSDRPNVFGTVALKVSRTSLDEKWRSVGGARVSGRAAAYAASLRKLDRMARLEAINRYVNRHVRFVDDSRQYGRADLWATANQTLSRGEGDCEDYAIAKLQMLRAAGFADTGVYLVILKDLVRRTDHAVAIVRLGDQMLVLDNGTDQVFESRSVTDYRPILTFAANGSWTHGYKVERSPVEIAQARATTVSELVPAGIAN